MSAYLLYCQIKCQQSALQTLHISLLCQFVFFYFENEMYAVCDVNFVPLILNALKQHFALENFILAKAVGNTVPPEIPLATETDALGESEVFLLQNCKLKH